MNIFLIGLNHRTAPVEVREQLAFTREGAATALMLFRNQFPTSEAAIISTCNRVELLIAAEGNSPSRQEILSFVAQSRDLPVNAFKNYLYQLSGEQACRHLFRVASGLDSMVLGESQILGQVKQAYAIASEQGTTGRVLNRLFHLAFETAKRIRTETQLGEGKVSIPAVAVDVARRIFEDFSSKQTFVIGAGEMARLVCEYLRDTDGRRFIITTRTATNARALAEACQGEAVPYDQLDEQLVSADIVITATACPQPILTADRVREAQKRRGGRLLYIIDLAVPRNVEPAVASLPRVFVYDIDSLGRIAGENEQRRAAELISCEQILDEEVVAFESWLERSCLSPLIERMYDDARELSEFELQRLFHKCPDLTHAQRQAVTQLVNRVVGKFMHPCVSSLRNRSATSERLASELHAAAVKVRGGAESRSASAPRPRDEETSES
jgi:glutamyl-tRNA reductase